MSAEDENRISENRRRLFKALSTAPVVMTLRPGEALARTSSYQCLEMPPDVTTPIHVQSGGALPPQCSDGDANCLAYVERLYWDSTDLSGVCLTRWNNNIAAGNIVIYDPVADSVKEIDLTGTVVQTFGANVTVSGNILSFPRQGGGSCDVEGKTGYFLLKISPVADLEGNLIDFDPVGPVPEAVGDASAKSCWNSFEKTATGVFFVQG